MTFLRPGGWQLCSPKIAAVYDTFVIVFAGAQGVFCDAKTVKRSPAAKEVEACITNAVAALNLVIQMGPGRWPHEVDVRTNALASFIVVGHGVF